jgi:hypothetical protein
MARPSSAAKSEAATAADDNSVSTDEINAIEDGKIFDYIRSTIWSRTSK